MSSGQHGPVVHTDGTTEFRVWAPLARSVELILGGTQTPLAAAERGWFGARVEAGHGDRYAFRLDGGPPRPDPASRWQPDGVHDASAVFDPGTLAWSAAERDWRGPGLAGAVFYELHVGTFTPEGTLDAAARRLGPLAELGVTHVELLPVNAFDGTAGWGYDGVLWYAVHQPYGGPAGLGRFVAAAHAAGLGVALDVVYNHLGPSGNYLPEYGPYLTDRYRTPWGDEPNLDGPGSDAVRTFILGSALGWFSDFRVDALRLDAVHGLIDNSSVHLLAELADRVRERAHQERRPLLLVAESDRNAPATVVERAAGGLGLDGQWADDLHHAVHVALTGEQEGYYVDYAGLPDVAAAYQRGFVYDGRYSRYRDKTIGAPLGEVPGHRLVACVQNHDQIGNRAAGERLTTLVSPALARVAAVLLCAAPSTPLLFMGEEYGDPAPFLFFTSHPEPELAEAVRRGRLDEFAHFSAFAGGDVPDPQDPATVARCVLDHDLADSDRGRGRRALHADLLALRRAHPALGGGRRDQVDVREAGMRQLLLVRGGADGDRVLLAVNLAPEAVERPLPWAGAQVLLCSEDERYGGATAAGTLIGTGDRLRMPPASATLIVETSVAQAQPTWL